MRRAILLFSLVFLGLSPDFSEASSDVREWLRQHVLTPDKEAELRVSGKRLYASDFLRDLYEAREWRPIWFDEEGLPSAVQSQLLPAIDRAADHGLVPDHYHRERLVWLQARLLDSVSGQDWVNFELLASDALIRLGYHLLHGRVDPETIDPEWLLQREVPDLFTALAESRSEGPVDLISVLDGLAPRYPAYTRLREQLALQRTLAANGNWTMIGSGALLRPGMADTRVAEIRERLKQLGDAVGDVQATPPGEVYDEALLAAVLIFQNRHGLEPDGIIGPRTLSELNLTPERRVAKLRANLERWRWLPRDLGEEYLLVNIAGYAMHVRSGGEIVLNQRVVVGTPFRRTPVFSSRMSYLVLNPSWEVPPRLAAQDVLPRIQADRTYLDRMGFAVYQGWGADERRIDPESIDWAQLSRRYFPYRLR